MNDIEYVALVDTTRDELRERIARAGQRFDRLARGADPRARPPGSDWTVQQVVAHVLTVAHRYRDFAQTGDYHRAAYPGELGLINQAELDAAMAPVPELLDQLHAVEPVIDSYFDAFANEGPVLPFHCGVLVDGITSQTNWLGELLVHISAEAAVVLRVALTEPATRAVTRLRCAPTDPRCTRRSGRR